MKKIRYNCFETNSSSTHAICIHNQEHMPLPSYIYFGLEDLEVYTDYNAIQHRANYLNTIMYICCDKTEYVNRQNSIKEMLNHYGIKSEWADVKWNVQRRTK